MTSIYDELQPVATALMKEFKQGTIKYIKLTAATGGTADNPGDPTETEYDLNATAKGASFKYLKDGFATVGDKELTCAVVEDLVPSKADFIVIDGERWKILADISVPAAGTRDVWKFIIRKGG